MSRKLYKILDPRQRPLIIALYYVVFAVIWIYLTSYLIRLGTDDAEFLRHVELIKGLLFVFLTGGMLYLLLRRWHTATALPHTDEFTKDIKQHKSYTRRLVIVFTALLCLVPLLSFFIVFTEKPLLEKQAFRDLKAISSLKAKQVETWLHERYSDGQTLTQEPSFAQQIYFLNQNNLTNSDKLLKRLDAFRRAYGYKSLMVLDTKGNVLLQSGATHPIFQDENNRSYLSSSDPDKAHSPVFRDSDGNLHFDLIVPLSGKIASGNFIGSLLIHIDPNQFLFPYLQHWPSDSQSGETLLVQQRGDFVQFLNQLRFTDKHPLDLHKPIDDNDLPAALALHNQQPGTYIGNDYRNVRVYAASHPVANTTWQVIAKLDQKEVLLPLYTLVRWISLISLFTVSIIALSLLMLWRLHHQANQLAIETEKVRVDRLLHLFYELPFIGMAVTSPTSKKWLQFNDYFCEMLGYNNDELVNMGWDEITHPDDLTKDLTLFERAIRGEIDSYALDKRFIRKNGSIIYTTIVVKAVRKPDGQLVYFVATIQDISQRYLAEQALRSKEQQLRTLIKTLPDLIWLKDAEGVYLMCNPMFERFFGTDEAGIVGKTDYDFVSKEEADFFRENDNKAMVAGKPSINEEWLAFKIGGYRGLFETIKTPMFDSEGKLIGILGNARDITERKISEQKIQQLNRVYATLSSTNEAIVHNNTEAGLLAEICHNAVEHGGFRMAWIGMIDRPSKLIVPVASYGQNTDYLDSLALSIDAESDNGTGPAGIALREGRPYWSQDFLHENFIWPWHDRAVQGGFAAAAVLPLFRNGQVTGGFILYSGERNTFDESSQKLLFEMASDISYALDNFDREQARQAAEERLALSIQGSNDAPWDWDLETNDFFYSSQWWQMLGYEPGELQSDANTWRRLAHPEDLGQVEQIIERILHTDIDRDQVECRYQHKHGHYVPTLIRGIVSRDSEGKAVRLTGTVMNLTERKAIEAELKQAATVFEQSQEGIIITDLDAKIRRVNKAFTNITGYSEEEALGKTPHLLSSGRQDAHFYNTMWETLNKNGNWQGEIWNRRKDGTEYPEWLSITRTFDDKGNVNGYIGIFQDITQRKKAEERIHWLAHFDALTTLPNRTLLRDRTEHAIKLARRNNSKVAFLYFDLDHFKNINDTLGHSVGDKLLSEVASRVLARLREEDTASRQGGDEFLVMLPNTDASGAANVAQDLLNTINRAYHIENFDLTITASIGITIYPDDGDHFEILSKSADIAMYKAKQLGRNNYCFYTAELESMTARTLKLESDMQYALKDEQFEIYYQPQVSLVDGSIVGVEALLRWHHPEFGMVSPADFIPIAENSGQILQIGEWVTHSAMQQLRQWINSGIAPIKVAINLSVRQLRQPDLIEKLGDMLKASDLDPQLVELEITESMLMDSQEEVIKTLHQISELGFQIAIDDFGTGYSSLSYLKRMPVDYLKIDQSFIKDMLENPDDAIIARTIITLGHSLGLNIIAEGVETGKQLDFLRAHHCDEIQGYLFSKPLPVNEISQLLRKSEHMSQLVDTHYNPEANTLLIVDDEENILRALKRTLRPEGYHIVTAKSGQEGLDLLAIHEVCLIISDQRMPDMSGVEFLNKAKELYPDTIRMVLSGYTDLKSITDAINRGDIYKFLTKPWDDELLRANIREAFQRFNITLENRRLARDLKNANKALAKLIKFNNT